MELASSPQPPVADGPSRGTTARLADGGLQVTVDVTRGPRISSLLGVTGEELLAALDPPEVAGAPPGPTLPLWGGHRLWPAPEVPEVTYRVDDGPCHLTDHGGQITAWDDGRPLARRIEVRLRDGVVHVDHLIENTGETAMAIGPWALTQVRPGGTVVVPIGQHPRDPHGLQAAGTIVTWPYTDLSDERYTFHRRWVTLEGRSLSDSTDDATKIGVDGFVPWVAYASGPTLLVVVSDPRPDDGHLADLGATTQVFTHRRFTELERVGPVVHLDPGAQVRLHQRWHVLANPSPQAPADVAAIAALADGLLTSL